MKCMLSEMAEKAGRNVGKSDQILRYILGVTILAAGLYTQSWWGLLGVFPILFAALRFCPAYKLIGFNTNKY